MRSLEVRLVVILFLFAMQTLAFQPQQIVSAMQNGNGNKAVPRVREIIAAKAPAEAKEISAEFWKNAKPAGNFIQKEPHEGQPASERTEVRVSYTKDAVYFAVNCYDSEPDKIIATERRRDQS